MKIYIPPYNIDEYHNHYFNEFFIAGFKENGCELVQNENEADYIILDMYHVDKYKIKYPNKTVMLDIQDLTYLYDVDVLHYFKRSCINKRAETSKMNIIEYKRKIIPFPLYVKKCYTNLNFEQKEKIYDICCTHLDMSFLGSNNRNIDRTKLVQFLNSKRSRSNYKFYMNYNQEQVPIGRSFINLEYFNTICKSKIVINCQPDEWEQDYRIWETLASGTLLFSDKILTPIKNPLIDKVHCVFYDKTNLDEMFKLVEYYLSHDEERERIATQGKEYVLKYHTYKARINEVLEYLK